ncbi:ABC transporter permease [Demequina sp.]|uniref:ABC transporter permease n=1 Tax=Demequina sp. TaxID=2050685 RepID=UPI0025CE0B33|nr:ABC transporter permease [Demequina sp.]
MTTTDYAALAREAGLPRVGARPPLVAYFKEMWERRHFATTMARYRIEATLSENRLGLAWVVLNPLLQAAVYGLIFGVIMPSSSRPPNFIPFLVTGFFIFTYFAQSFSQGAKAITGNASLVRSLSFPRMLLPISAVLQQLYQLVPMMIVLVVILVAFGEYPTWEWLLVVPILGLMTMFNLGVAFIAARLTVHLRDVTQIIPLITRILFYLTGIFYSLELVLADRPNLLKIAQLNPVHDYVALVRASMLDGQEHSTVLWVVASVSAVAFLVFGIVFFWKAEERYGHD